MLLKLSAIISCANECRKIILNKYGNVQGNCVECSELIISSLDSLGIKAQLIEGWVEFDYYEGCTNYSYDPHSWVEFSSNNIKYILDATCDQFNYFLVENMPEIYLGINLPKGWSYKEPLNKIL